MLKLAALADVHVWADEAQVASAHQWACLAVIARDAWMNNLVSLGQLLQLHRSGHVHLNLLLNHLKKHLLMLSVHSAGALASAARVRSPLLSLAAITAETGNSHVEHRVLILLSFELLVGFSQLLDLCLVDF